HTIGHAIEAVTGYEGFAHGEAVSLGIAAEAGIAERLCLAKRGTRGRQLAALHAVGLPVGGAGEPPAPPLATPLPTTHSTHLPLSVRDAPHPHRLRRASRHQPRGPRRPRLGHSEGAAPPFRPTPEDSIARASPRSKRNI